MSIFSNKEQEQDNHAVTPIPEQFRKSEKVIIITDNNVEDIEFFYPYYRLSEEGYTVDIVTPNGEKFEGKHGLGLKTSRAIDDVQHQNYELLYLPGGKAPAELRKYEEVLNFVKEFARSGKPIAAVCHGPQILISAGLVKGKRMACWPEVANELEKAGGKFVDEPVVQDGQFFTARKPGDLPWHLHSVLQYVKDNISGQSRTARSSSAA